MKASSHVIIPLRSNAILNIESSDEYCFLWSKSANLHPCKNDHLNIVSSYRKYFDELNIGGFDFSIGFKCNDGHIFENINNLSMKMFELIFYQDQNKWKHNLIPVEICKNDSDTVVDL